MDGTFDKENIVRGRLLICDLMFIGHISIDQIEYQDGIREQPGGAALYSTIGARTLVKNVTLVSAIGTDYLYKNIINYVGSKFVRTFKMPSTRFYIRYHKFGNVDYIKSKFGAGSRITASSIPTQLLTPKTIVHVSPMHPKKVQKIIKTIKTVSPKTKISINTWIDYIKKSRKNRKILKNLASEVDYFILNDSEVKVLTETDSISTALTLLKSKMLIVTLGEIGALISGEEVGTQMIPALNTPNRNVIDTVGAGDVWCGTFLATYKLTEDLLKSVTIASILSSLKCSGWNFQKILNLRFKKPDDVIEYVIGIKEGALQKRISDY